ncbi:MAG: hypothetical protein GC201_18525 [Alphaproteobacteria bacterium]|nr:hypothetical protein [Alphaproteobacteria bacterium]
MFRPVATAFIGLTALLFAPAAGIAAPATSQAAASCAGAAPAKAMMDCLLDRAEELLKAPATLANDKQSADVLWVLVARIAEEAGEPDRLRGAVDHIGDAGAKRIAQGRLGAVLARKGDTAGADAVLKALLAQAPPEGQTVDVAPAHVLAALNDTARIRAYLDGLPAPRRADGLLAMIAELEKADHFDRAQSLLDDYAGKVDASAVPIVVHLPAALAFVGKGQLEAALRMASLLPQADRLRVQSRVALARDKDGRSAEAVAAVRKMMANSPRSTDPQLAAAVLAARHGNFDDAQAKFPLTMSYDPVLLDEFWRLFAAAGQADMAANMIDTMNSGKDRVAGYAKLALDVAGKDPAKAAELLTKARAVVDLVLDQPHGAAQQLMSFGPALVDMVRAYLALGQVTDARALVDRLESRFAADPYGLLRSRATETLTATNQAVFAHLLKRGKADAVRAAIDGKRWRGTAARNAFAEAGRFAEAARVAEQPGRPPVAKLGDFLSVAQYIAEK